MSKFIHRTETIEFRVGNINSFFESNSSNGAASKITILVSSVQQIPSLKKKKFVSTTESPKSPFDNEIKVYTTKPRSLQWSIIDSIACTSSHTNEWGSTCNGITIGEMWSAQKMKYRTNIL